MQNNTQDFPVKRSVACYFCNELLEDRYLQIHVNHCGQVLEQCSYRCGVYVPRRAKEKHSKECVMYLKRKTRYSTGSTILLNNQSSYDMNPSSSVQSHYQQLSSHPTWNKPAPQVPYQVINEAQSVPVMNNVLKQLETEVVALKTTLSEERNLRLQQEAELKRMHAFMKDLQNKNTQVETIIDSVQKFQQEYDQVNNTSLEQNKSEFEKIHLKYKLIEEWKKHLQLSIENIKSSVADESSRRYEFTTVLKQIEEKLFVVDNLGSDIDMLRNALLQEQSNRELELGKLKNDFLNFREFLSQENVMISAIWNEQLEELRRFKSDVQEIDLELKDMSVKQHEHIFELKSVSQISNECFDKCTINSKELTILKKSLAQLRQNFEDLETSFNKTKIVDGVPFNLNGHLLWKISNYKEKMANAKDNDVVLQSPLFYNKQYGYALRVELHLNGIGKWKGRHLIACLIILKGEWDALLDWPCILQATVTLKDQTLPKCEAKDIVKNLIAKKKIEDIEKEDLAETSKQHIFIPHAVLEKQQYIKDDVIFLEIQANETLKSK